MKRAGQHPDRELNPIRIKGLTKPGRYPDGNGLYLVVDPSGAKRWMLRTVVQGRRRDIGLGGLQLVSLGEARDKATELRRLAREGGDPLEQRRKARLVVPTFEDAARTVHKEHGPAWKNPKHAAQWLSTLEQYAFPHFGARRVDQIATADVLRALSPIWLTKPETARRVRQRIAAVFDWTKAAGLRSGDNPVEGVTKGLPRQNDRAEHHAALPYGSVPAFVQRLKAGPAGENVKLAFELLILTGCRTGEVVNARRSEIDLAAATWTIPAERMKAGREHRVPLSERAVEILKRAMVIAADSEFVFPGQSPKKPISNMAFLMTLRRMNEDVTAHGFRSAFRDWASERTNFPREVCEMALAHTIKNKAEAAYSRSDLLDKRRDLMKTWSAFVGHTSGDVVAIRA